MTSTDCKEVPTFKDPYSYPMVDKRAALKNLGFTEDGATRCLQVLAQERWDASG